MQIFPILLLSTIVPPQRFFFSFFLVASCRGMAPTVSAVLYSLAVRSNWTTHCEMWEN